ncbi:ATP-binding domain-containing protein [Streptomyces thinghirensis]|nr:ATP-binding domain-containing protein [Streptomyces thinghirensis]
MRLLETRPPRPGTPAVQLGCHIRSLPRPRPRPSGRRPRPPASAKGLDFDTVVIADAESDAGTDPTSATLRMAYYVMITRARERLVLGWQGSRMPWHLEGLHGWAHMR